MQINKTNICLLQGDITRQVVDVIVNAANPSLAGGGGVDGAIHRAGGPEIMQELNELKRHPSGCATGSAVITGAGRLSARHVVHAVGPRYRGGHDGEAQLLAAAYGSGLKLAVAVQAQTVAFPSISTGIYAYPVEDAALIALQTVADFCRQPVCLRQVRFLLFDAQTLRAFENALAKIAP